MELDLKEFSLTLAVGLAVAGVLWLSLRCVWEERATAVRKLVMVAESPRVIPLIFASVGLLAVGMIAEDLSKNALAERNPSAFAAQFRWMMPSERFDRSFTLAQSPKSVAAAHGVERCKFSKFDDDHRSTLVRFAYTEVGNDLRRFVAQVDPLVDEAHSASRWLGAESGWQRIPSNPKADPEAAPEVFEATCASYEGSLAPLYYVAKNRAFTNQNFFKELQSLRIRYEFARSICYVLLVGAYLVVVLFLAQNTLTMWRDIGGGKTVISAFLALVVVCAALDATVFVSSEDVCRAVGSTSASCPSRLNVSRLLLLPATFIFVCLYRTRRMWPRLKETFMLSIKTVEPNRPIFGHQRERDARNAIVSVVVLFMIFIPVRLAYESDHSSYLKRVFAYYIVERGSKSPGPIPAATDLAKKELLP
jgi:hypothetical protein